MTIYPVLLSGGSGTRLWPLSRAAYPKQFLRLPPSQPGTLFQNTARRLDDRDDTADPTVICSNAHRFIVTEQLEACGCAARKIYLEPVGRNTAPAVTVAALSVAEEDPEGIMVVMPCDHIMDDPAAFARRVDDAVEAARGAGGLFCSASPQANRIPALVTSRAERRWIAHAPAHTKFYLLLKSPMRKPPQPSLNKAATTGTAAFSFCLRQCF